MNFKVGDYVIVNTKKYDDEYGQEYGSFGEVTRIRAGTVWVTFKPGAINNEHETFGTYDPEDLAPPTKLAKALK